jgi:6-pyruvoyltetrahydropterin/6-carboxytetrahydropterin synthase
MLDVTYTLELPLGHRLQNHGGKCRAAHGHNYLISVTLRGDVDPRTGMVIDFSDLKDICRGFFSDWDHAFCLELGDPLVEGLRPFARLRTIPIPPTAENLAIHWARGLQALLNMQEVHIRVQETRDCFTSHTEFARHA